jgi:hypothetical protein
MNGPTRLGQGSKHGNCFGEALGVSFSVILTPEQENAFFARADDSEATHVGFLNAAGELEHIARIKRKQGQLLEWSVEGKVAYGAGRYACSVRHLVDGFELDRQDRRAGRVATVRYGAPVALKRLRTWAEWAAWK